MSVKTLAIAVPLLTASLAAQAQTIETQDPHLQSVLDSILGGCLDDAEAVRTAHERFYDPDRPLAGAAAPDLGAAIAEALAVPPETVTAEPAGPQSEIGAVTVATQGTYQSLPVVSYSFSLPCECGFSFWAIGFDAPEEEVKRLFAGALETARKRVSEVLENESDGLEIGVERNDQAPGAATQLYCAWST